VAIANADAARNCHHVEVRLTNTSATLTCVDRLLAPESAPSGPGSDNGCTNPVHNIIHLYADTNETGDSLCIYGTSTGWLNLNTIPHGWLGIYGSWDNIASSYSINGRTCWGTFTDGNNGTGASQLFWAGSSGNFGSRGTLSNDTLSSVGATTGC
jgi:hypothetical protein